MMYSLVFGQKEEIVIQTLFWDVQEKYKNSGLSNATSEQPKLAFFHGKICPPQSRNCQNRNSHISKIVCQQASSRPHFRAVRKVLWKMVKNCVRNRSRPDEIDTETEICTSLKSKFYFRFCWPPSTKSTLISYISVGVFVTICGKTCPPQSLNWKMGFCTPLKSEIYFRSVSETTGI